MLRELIEKNRSYRRFDESYEIEIDTLRELVDLARLSPSAANMQPLRYYISNLSHINEKIFQCIGWAGYLKDWKGPAEGEHPTAYIIMLADVKIASHLTFDPGIASQSILLGATEKGLGGCNIASVQKNKIRKMIGISNDYEILLVIALGKPKETVIIEDINLNGDIFYWRDDKQIHHVPKRKLDDIIIQF